MTGYRAPFIRIETESGTVYVLDLVRGLILRERRDDDGALTGDGQVLTLYSLEAEPEVGTPLLAWIGHPSDGRPLFRATAPITSLEYRETRDR